MFAQRGLRVPLQMSARGLRPATLRAAAIAPFSTKPAPLQKQQQQVTIKSKWFAPPPPPAKYMVPVKAAMPQLVPFYFVNEVVFAFTIIPLLVYVFSKYILPRKSGDTRRGFILASSERARRHVTATAM